MSCWNHYRNAWTYSHTDVHPNSCSSFFGRDWSLSLSFFFSTYRSWSVFLWRRDIFYTKGKLCAVDPFSLTKERTHNDSGVTDFATQLLFSSHGKNLFYAALRSSCRTQTLVTFSSIEGEEYSLWFLQNKKIRKDEYIPSNFHSFDI